MPELTIRLHHDSLSELEEIHKKLDGLPPGTDWYDLGITTGRACPRCDGDIEGRYDSDGWTYSCPYCQLQMELNGEELQEVVE